MVINLDPELRRYVDDLVNAGRFSSLDQAIACAIAIMRDSERNAQYELMEPELLKRLESSQRDIEEGRFKSADEVRKIFESRFKSGGASRE